MALHRLLGAAPRTSLAKPPRRWLLRDQKGVKGRGAPISIHEKSEFVVRIHIPAKNGGGGGRLLATLGHVVVLPFISLAWSRFAVLAFISLALPWYKVDEASSEP